MNILKTLLAGLVLAASSLGAHAATYYADSVIDVNPGACTGTALGCAANDRQNVGNAVDTDNSTFYSLGFGGDITLGFPIALFTGPQTLSVFEVTFNRGGGDGEAAEVYGVLGGIETLLGTITNVVGENAVLASGAFEYIKLVDVTLDLFPATSSYDGFDVGAITISAVPLPAAGVLLLAGLGGLAAMRRRRNAA
ncbi:VPLPA-CTERM sorting domain-containing protein [Paracoccus shandongensis]|uniref:VPLPA-CTERM sorting domain-containing protein n=1 Tax=Paracoccus shandongensis TaxID=2816048 RepID=UPI001F4535D4|nr:VPLPA-CTERM sorting domain-containing protein [Paracoccus shandongensis]